MTTLEATVSILKQLPEEKLQVINNMAIRLLSDEGDNPFRPLTEAEWLDKLDVAREHAGEGRVREAAEASAALREKYHLA